MHKRKFNKEAYNQTDNACKHATVAIMKSRGYELKGDVNHENFQKWDLEFFHPEKKITIIVENEMRENFELLKTRYNSIHIPIRKRLSPATYYLVWNYQVDEFALIENQFLTSSPVVEIVCKARGDVPSYTEEMVDVSKKNIQFFKLIDSKWKLQNTKK